MSEPSLPPTSSPNSADSKPYPVLFCKLDINPFESEVARALCVAEYHLRAACRHAERELSRAARLIDLVARRHPELLAELDAARQMIPGPQIDYPPAEEGPNPQPLIRGPSPPA